MSKIAFKTKKETKIPYSYSTKNFNKGKENNLLSPTKDNTNFKKITSSGIVGISGLSPIIVYKKTLKGNQNKEKYRIKRQVRNANYISDGGLKQKLEKFNSGFGFSSSPLSHNHQMKTTKNKYNKNNNIFYEEKEKESFPNKKFKIAEQKLFSSTVRESNKRPIFPKNEKMKNCYKTKNGFGIKYKNIKEVNKNEENKENKKKYKEEKIK